MGLTGSDNQSGANLKIKAMNKLYYTKSDGLNYPVGAKMNSNKSVINEFFKAFKELIELRSDTVINFICRGSSGAILASHFAMNIENESYIVYVRKDGEMKECHSGHSDDFRPLSYAKAHNVIIDDFICSGNTINQIYAQISNIYPGIKIDGVVVTGGDFCTDTFKPKYFLTGRY